MAITTLMVHVDLQGGDDAALRLAGELAGRFGSRIIGVAAGFPGIPLHAEGMIATNLLEIDQDAFDRQVAASEERFRAELASCGAALEWRAGTANPALFLAEQSRAADLVIAGRPEPAPGRLPGLALDIGDAIMRAGRPVLAVPPDRTRLRLERVLVGWKDTPEARRAVAAALPLLKQAREVLVIEIVPAEPDQRAERAVADVAAWLARHGVAAQTRTELAAGHVGSHLDLIAVQAGADLIVAGAYGHSRLREWAFGGATRRLLDHASVCTLLMH